MQATQSYWLQSRGVPSYRGRRHFLLADMTLAATPAATSTALFSTGIWPSLSSPSVPPPPMSLPPLLSLQSPAAAVAVAPVGGVRDVAGVIKLLSLRVETPVSEGILGYQRTLCAREHGQLHRQCPCTPRETSPVSTFALYGTRHLRALRFARFASLASFALFTVAQNLMSIPSSSRLAR